ncbi:MAG: acyl-CoA dehydrogenase [Betaproteobacteria bacterium RIFCSPLOWO2_12_FULL_65_14]|nr:MAG: acyl-CoA dehydrogenase [Betaproteobacteria bacterium RIFCSPLOWO2_12_FULL_65_14]
MTPRFAHLDWPFFEGHGKLALDADAWARDSLGDWVHDPDADAVCRRLVGAMGSAGWLRYAVGNGEGGDLRALCLLREVFAYHGGLPDFAFAMQGLGTRSIALCGSEALKARYLPEAAAGRSIAAFALSEPDAGSDVGALSARARRDGEHYVLDGVKTWISNGGIADFYVVFARTDEAISAFVVEAPSDGLDASQRIDIVAPHPMATLRFTQCRVPATNVLGAPGEGFKVAMRTLDVFRTTVAAAALGLARRALDEALARATSRRMFGQRLADFQLTQARLADMATAIDAAALLTYRAAWARDSGVQRVTTEASMAKMFATEAAQQVVDSAVQLLGGLGVVHGHPVERLYREVRSLRIYEGATEVQKLIIARQMLRGAAA